MFKDFILSFPSIYNLCQNVISKKNSDVYRSYINILEKCKVLDIGCGTAKILDKIPESVEYHGFDISENYIKSAIIRYKNRARTFFKVSPINSKALDANQTGTFDFALSTGVLHHISNSEALDLLNLARNALKSNGLLVTQDPCYVSHQNFIAKFLASMDRGHYVRTVDEYKSLAEDVFPGKVEIILRNDLLRVPYNHIIMRMTKQ
jgi:2-polyprenyl-3-methyl-5-hydroxy-6-metoxy-1,4-benzoquinol methylase